jgi:hypothetical protein
LKAWSAVGVASLCLTAACQAPGSYRPPGSSHGCSTTSINWVNFIQVGSTRYVGGPEPYVPLQESDLGPVYARVKFKVSGNICDASYRIKDGDAGVLDPGTPIYEVNGQSPAKQLAARFQGRIVTYLPGGS